MFLLIEKIMDFTAKGYKYFIENVVNCRNAAKSESFSGTTNFLIKPCSDIYLMTLYHNIVLFEHTA